MSNQAVNIDKFWHSVEGKVRVVPGGRSTGRTRCIASHSRTSHAELLTLGLILAIFQILDGVLTGLGMAQYGTVMEGNALLRYLMHQIGYIPALVLTKGIALAVIAALCQQAFTVKWLKLAFTTIIVMYAVLAIVPWTFVLAKGLLG